jgi:peptidoglycan/LPS O-acetylase OafA/YrhL
VLAVVLYHFAPSLVPGGFLGVDLFFVLSGFLITGLLVNEWRESGRIGLRRFWARRARRLLPALLFVLGIVGIYAILVTDRVTGRAIARDGISALLYVANWHFIDASEAYIKTTNIELSPLRHMWSLAIEEQFYLVWPLVVAGLGMFLASVRRGGRSLGRAVAGLSAVLGVLSIVRMITLYSPTAPDRVYYGTDSRAFLLLIGAAVGAFTAGAPLVTGARHRRLVAAAGVVVGTGLLVLMAIVDAADSWLYRGGYGLIGLAMVFALVAAAQPGWNPLGKVLENAGLVGLGVISYGVYLWHWPAVIWLTDSRTGFHGPALFGIRTVATLAAAVASYYLLERPIRQRRWRLSLLPAWLRPVPAGALVIAVSILLLVTALASPGSVNASAASAPAQANAASAAAYQRAPHCDGTERSDGTLAGIRVLLVGNSVAHEISGCLRALLSNHGASVESIATNALPLCDFAERAREQFAQPAGTQPNVVIVFNVPSYEGCTTPENERAQFDEMLRVWARYNVHTYLVPFLPPPPSKDPPPYTTAVWAGPIWWNTLRDMQVRLYDSVASGQPDRISVLDVGGYLRVDNDHYLWRTPCTSAAEPGCDANGQIFLRFPGDGVHLCSDPTWDGATCDPRYEGGRRRVVAALVEQILKSPPH